MPENHLLRLIDKHIRNLIFQTDAVEQRFGTVVLPMMISRPPTIEIKQSMGGCFLLNASAKSHPANRRLFQHPRLFSTVIINAVSDEFGAPMAFPTKVCSICSEEFELKPDKPGFANRCPACSEQEPVERATTPENATQRSSNKELNQERKKAMRDLLYRKDR